MCIALPLEKQDFQNGSIIVFNGKQRVGKTSLMTAMICDNFKRYNKLRFKNACAELLQIGRAKGVNLTCDSVMYFSNYDILLDAKRGIHTHAIDKWDLAVPNDKVIQYYPPYSVIAFMELDKHFNNRAWNMRGADDESKSLVSYVSKFVYMFFATLGQHHLTLLIDYQIFEKLDSALRSLVTDCIYVLGKRDIKRGLFRREKNIYSFVWTYPQNISFFEKVSALGITPRAGDVYKRCRYRFKGNIHTRYDSFSCNPLYYDGLNQYEYKRHPSIDWRDDESLKEYCKVIFDS